MAVETRPIFTETLLLQLQALHDRVGRPHCIMINQAHCFMSREAASSTARLSEITMIYATSEPELLPTHVLKSVKLIVSADDAEALPCPRSC